jgi:hypothetical protein
MSRHRISASPLLRCVAVIAVSAAVAAQRGSSGDPDRVATGLNELFLHDECTADYAPQPDTCLHKQLVEKTVTLGGKAGAVYDVRLRVRGIFEPTTIAGGETPQPEQPFYQVGGTVRAREWSAGHIEVTNPKQTYWLNHYPKVGHIIYNEDFETTIPMAAGATVVVRVVDGNDRQIDNAEVDENRKDRLQIIKGVTDKPLAGQMLRLDVVRVTAR